MVKHLDPEQYFNKKGLDLLLEKLRHSPLQTLPIPDSFQKLERWNNLRRRDNESIPEFLVREEEGFSELQLSLRRSRDLAGRPVASSDKVPGETPAQDDAEEAAADDEFADLPDFRIASPSSPPSRRPKAPSSPAARSSGTKAAAETAAPDFFSDELRGYRLLKGAGLTVQERQQVLTLSNNKVNFEVIRQALRAFADDSSEGRRHRHRERAAWWTDEAADDYLNPEDEDYAEDVEEAYWGDPSWDGSGTGWDDGEWDPWTDETAYYEDPAVHEALFEDEASPSPDKAETLKQESEAVAGLCSRLGRPWPRSGRPVATTLRARAPEQPVA